MKMPKYLILLFLLAVAGCSQTTAVTYDLSLDSTPSGVVIEAEDGTEIGETPAVQTRELEVRRARWGKGKRWQINSGIYGALGLVMLRSASSDRRDESSQLVLKSMGLGFLLLSVPLFLMGRFMYSSRDTIYISSKDNLFPGEISLDEIEDRTLDELVAEVSLPRFFARGPDGQQRNEVFVSGRTSVPVGQAADMEYDRLDTTNPPSLAVRGMPDPPSEEIASVQPQPQKAMEQPPKPVEVQSPPATTSGPSFIAGAPQPNAYAFIVGIENYRSVTPTPGARADAEQFAQMLETSLGVPGRNIRLLTDDNATRSDLLATVSWMQRNVSADARIYFFFSGHGAPNVNSGQSFLLPYEGEPETIEFSGISLDDILEGLGQSGARDVLAFVDACFSGSGERSALPEGSRPLVPVKDTTTNHTTNVVLVASSAAHEISGTTSDGSQGLFTHHLIHALGEGRADMDGDGMISLHELHSYITPRVARDARRLNREQTPTISIADELGETSNLMMMWGLPR